MKYKDVKTGHVNSLWIEQTFTIGVAAQRAFRAFTEEVSKWWGPPYVQSPETQKMILEPVLGGRFYEGTDEGEGTLWGTVTGIESGRVVEITGPIGMQGAVLGVLRVEFSETPQGDTLLLIQHQAVGQIPSDTPLYYEQVWDDLFGHRFRSWLERATPLGLDRSRKSQESYYHHFIPGTYPH